MRNILAVGFAVGAFGLGAWSSARVTAARAEGFPVSLQPGQRISTVQSAVSMCEITQQSSVAGEWVQCKATAEWRNLATGYGFIFHDSKR